MVDTLPRFRVISVTEGAALRYHVEGDSAVNASEGIAHVRAKVKAEYPTGSLVFTAPKLAANGRYRAVGWLDA